MAGSTVRFKDTRAEIGWKQGTFLGWSGATMQVHPANSADTLSLTPASLAELQMSHGSQRQTRRGALIGGVAGGVVGASLGAMAAVVTHEGDMVDIGAEAVPILAFIFGGGGAVLGAMVGSLVPGERWEDVPPSWVVGAAPQKGGLRIELGVRMR